MFKEITSLMFDINSHYMINNILKVKKCNFNLQNRYRNNLLSASVEKFCISAYLVLVSIHESDAFIQSCIQMRKPLLFT